MHNLLMVFSLLPYPLRAHGVSVRYLPIIKNLTKNYKIDIILITSNEAEIRGSNALKSICNNITIIRDPRGYEHNIFDKFITLSKYIIPWNPPSTFISHNERSVTTEIKQVAKNKHYTAVIMVGHYLLPNLISALPFIKKDKVIVDFIDSPTLWARRTKDKVFKFNILEKYEKWKINKWELKIIKGVDSVVYVSSVDAQTIPLSLTPGKIRHIIPNGLNVDNYTKEKNPYIPSTNIGFLGNMSYGPNVEAVHWLYENVFVPLRTKKPDLTLVIIGRDPVESVRELGRRPGVKVTGSVIDIWPYINSIDIFVFPINMGAGLKNKILETMYARKPVITTDMGNEGINAIPGQDLLICRTPEDFQREVTRLFNIPEEGIKIGNSARKFIEQKFDWEKIFKKYEALINGGVIDV